MNSVHRVSWPPSARDHDVGDVAVDHVIGVEHHGADRVPSASCSERVGVGFVGGQQRQLGQRGAQQRCGHQRLAELLENDGGIGEFAAGAAEFLGHHQRGGADLLAQQLSTATRRSRARTPSPRAPPPASRACRPARRRSRAAVPFFVQSCARLRTPPALAAGARSDRPTPSAAPAPAAATATGRVPG